MKPLKQTIAVAMTTTWMLISPVAMGAEQHGNHGAEQHGNHGAEQHGKAHAVQATGTLNTVNPEKRRVNITHTPIPELQWPAMRMDFTVQDGVMLKHLKPGQPVRFTLEPSGTYDHVITQIKPR